MRIGSCLLTLAALAWLLLVASPWSRVPLRPRQFPRWNLAFSDGIDATLFPAGDGFRATVARQLTGDAWQVRVERRVDLRADRRQVLRLRVRADRPQILLVVIRQVTPPWDELGLRVNVPVGTEWLNWEMSFQPTKHIPDAVLTLGIGGTEGTVELQHAEVLPLLPHRSGPQARQTIRDSRTASTRGVPAVSHRFSATDERR